MKIAIVIPTIRPDSFIKFVDTWRPLFDKHEVELVTVFDGPDPVVTHGYDFAKTYSVKEIMGKYAGAIVKQNGGVRNLGFAYIAKYLPEVEIIITLDDDTKPIGDPIQDHLNILKSKVPISWMSTASEYMRGFPYKIRDEAEVVLSHGVWENVADWDAPTQLVKGSHRKVDFPKMPVPKGIYFPMCIMNVGFKRKMLPFMYQAPPAYEMNIGRTDDIYCGILAKREIDKNGWAAVTGYARIWHERESNVYKNLNLEAKTIELMEGFWQGDESHPYFKIYRDKLNTWQKFIQTTLQ
jgi:reversibly glycosylated polypeptide / UDP-arabinopyranose mutase